MRIRQLARNEDVSGRRDRHVGSAPTARAIGSGHRPRSALTEFEQIYAANAEVVIVYFARRCAEPQVVADLTSETFVRAVGGLVASIGGGVRRGRGCSGSPANVFACHCAQTADARDAVVRLAGQRPLDADEIDELAEKIDAERAGRELLERCLQLPNLERAAVELVDLSGLTPKEAAAALGVPRAVLRKRLSRARARLRKEDHRNG